MRRMDIQIVGSRHNERGIVMIAVTIGLILIAAGLGGIYLMAQQALEDQQPRVAHKSLQGFAKEMVQLCGNILHVSANTYGYGVSDVDAFISGLQSDSQLGLQLITQPLPDVSRVPASLQGTVGSNSGIEEEFYAMMATDDLDAFDDAAQFRFDRDANSKFVPDLIAKRGKLMATIDIDYIGRDSTGTRSCAGVIKWDGSGEASCKRSGGGNDPGAANPAAKHFPEAGLFRCRIDAKDTSSDKTLVVETIIRHRKGG